MLFGVLGGLIAIPFGHIALHQIKQTGEEGHTAAVVGLVLGYLWLAVIVITFGWLIAGS